MSDFIPVITCLIFAACGFLGGILMPFRPCRGPADLTREDTRILNSADTATLVDWYIRLNCWEWPDELPDEEIAREGGRRSSIMRAIENRVGSYAISHQWNTFQRWYLDPKAHYEAKYAALEAARAANTPTAAGGK